jgi:uncharacterized membrane protein YhhN
MARWALTAALIAGASYLAAPYVEIGDAANIAWKGAGVCLLALYAGLQAKNLDGWLITMVMAFGALGDVLLEAVGLETGAIAFVVGHVIAVGLYLRNRRSLTSPSQRMLAAVIVPLSLLIAFIMMRDVGIVVYTAFVAVMAATAWMSRFPRYRTGIGAMMFLGSDLLIFASIGPFEGASWISPAIWMLYFGGQLLIVVGVTGVLNKDPLREIEGKAQTMSPS